MSGGSTSLKQGSSGGSHAPATHRWRAIAACGAGAGMVLGLLGPVGAQAANEPISLSGQLANGTEYAINVPADWSGTLILEADLQSATSAKSRWLAEQGYALASRSRNVTDWDVGGGSRDLIELRDIFIDEVGAQPELTIVSGGSLGGLVSRDAATTYGDVFDGVIPMCGGGAGLVGMWNHRLDATYALDVLVGDDAIELVNITDQAAADAALRDLVSEAMSTPEGTARLALAGAIGGVSGRPAGQPEPAADDYVTRMQTTASSVSLMLLRRSVLEDFAGGNISWNVGVDYTQQFETSGQTEMVRDLYRQAGLDLAADLATLATSERISADAVAVDWARSNGVYDGVLEMPMLSMFTAVDPRAALSELSAYEQTVAIGGSSEMLRQVVVDRAGHCSFTAGEFAAALDALMERIQSGSWGDLTSAASLNARAAALQAETEIPLGGSAYYEVTDVPAFPRLFMSDTALPLDETAGGIPVSVAVVDDPGVLTLTVAEFGAGVELVRTGNVGDRLRFAGELPKITVTDSRNAAQAAGGGWGTSGQSSAFSSTAGSVSAAHFGWDPRVLEGRDGVAAGARSTTLLDGGAGLSSPSSLATATDEGRRGSTSLGAGLFLDIPVDTAEGRYGATVTVSLFPLD